MAASRVLAVAVMLGLGLIGCSSAAKVEPPPAPVHIVDPVTVKVPVQVRRDPPKELADAYKPEALPAFVAPAESAATSALTPEGEKRLKLLVHDLLVRDEAWRKWANEPDPPLEAGP